MLYKIQSFVLNDIRTPCFYPFCSKRQKRPRNTKSFKLYFTVLTPATAPAVAISNAIALRIANGNPTPASIPIKRYNAPNRITTPAIPSPTNNPREPIFRAVINDVMNKMTTKAPYKTLDANSTPTISKYNNDAMINEINKLLTNAKMIPIPVDFNSFSVIKKHPNF